MTPSIVKNVDSSTCSSSATDNITAPTSINDIAGCSDLQLPQLPQSHSRVVIFGDFDDELTIDNFGTQYRPSIPELVVSRTTQNSKFRDWVQSFINCFAFWSVRPLHLSS